MESIAVLLFCSGGMGIGSIFLGMFLVAVKLLNVVLRLDKFVVEESERFALYI